MQECKFFDEVLLFFEPEESTNLRFMSAYQVNMFFREDDQVLVMFASLRMENDVVASEVLVVC